MAVIYHTIAVWDGPQWAEFTIENGRFIAHEGAWPGGYVAGKVDTPLEDASYIYLLPDGRYLLSTDFVPYGFAPEAQAADLLAWREWGDWHVKRLEVEKT